jgi:hypothetical protein
MENRDNIRLNLESAVSWESIAMTKTDRSEKQKSNPTYEKLNDLPFKTASELKDAQHAVRMRIWKRLEEARVLDTYLGRPEYGFIREEFKEGLRCGYGESSENLVRVFAEGPGIQICINKDLAESIPSSESLLGVLVRAMSESFANTYYKAKGILPPSDHDPDQSQATRYAHAPAAGKKAP